MTTAASGAPALVGRVLAGTVAVDPFDEAAVVAAIEKGWATGRGGRIATPNVDICWALGRDTSLRPLLDSADIVVADGAPLIWAAALAGTPLPGRIPGSGLVESLCGLADRAGRSVFIVAGGDASVATRAERGLLTRFPDLRVVGSAVPPYGFDDNTEQLRSLLDAVAAASPDLVLIGLGFPRQERIGALIRERLPGAWVLGCGGGLAMVAGDRRRASPLVQRIGAEWLFRLVQEPRRLFKRYIVHDIPVAMRMLSHASMLRLRR